MKNRATLRQIGIVLKYVVPLAIIVWLVGAIEPEQRRQLVEQPKNWPLLTVAFALAMGAVCLTFIRWHLLVRTLDIPFRMRDAFRLGFLGYLFNFVSVGAVGGDLFKAVFIAHEHPRRRAEAIATVVVDRMIGLYALLVLTALATLAIDMPNPTPEMLAICRATYLFTGLGGVAVLMVLIPGFTSGSLSEFLRGLPKIGTTLGRLIDAVRMYRNRPDIIAVIGVMSLGVHALLSLSMYLTALALYREVPTLTEHLIIVPLSMVAGAIPFTPAGLGTFEFAIDKLYAWVPAVQTGVSGILLGLVYRVITIAIAAVGVVYYWTSRREVRQLIDEAQHDLESDEGELTSPATATISCESRPSNS